MQTMVLIPHHGSPTLFMLYTIYTYIYIYRYLGSFGVSTGGTAAMAIRVVMAKHIDLGVRRGASLDVAA